MTTIDPQVSLIRSLFYPGKTDSAFQKTVIKNGFTDAKDYMETIFKVDNAHLPMLRLWITGPTPTKQTLLALIQGQS